MISQLSISLLRPLLLHQKVVLIALPWTIFRCFHHNTSLPEELQTYYLTGISQVMELSWFLAQLLEIFSCHLLLMTLLQMALNSKGKICTTVPIMQQLTQRPNNLRCFKCKREDIEIKRERKNPLFCCIRGY